jgi:precorrin-8X/cobalt-precorrin-8 methylmutase
MGASTKQGHEIATKSREIVQSLIKDKVKNLSSQEKDIVERIVHSTADPEYADLIAISSNFIKAILKSLKAKEDILTDINMVKSGITQYDGNVECFIKNKETIAITKEATKATTTKEKEKKITRAAAAIQYAADNDFEGIIAIGNAPTALYKAIELKEKGELNVKAIVGVPVGFVGAANSKEALQKTDIPNIITKGPKGGTPVAVAIVNSLIQTINNKD